MQLFARENKGFFSRSDSCISILMLHFTEVSVGLGLVRPDMAVEKAERHSGI
jgi:hypothetical protein